MSSAAVPYAHVPLPPVIAFISIYATAILINNLITAALLFGQFYVVRWNSLLVLATGYLFTALLILPYALTFPGVFGPSQPFGAGSQTAAWLSIFWHLGSSIALIIAAVMKDVPANAGIQKGSSVRDIAKSVVIAMVLAGSLTWAVIQSQEILPPIFVNGIYLSTNKWPLWVLIAFDVMALALLLRRRTSVLSLWLTVMCVTWLVEIFHGGILAGARFSHGWYVARVFGLGGTFIVLLVLLSETITLYSSMARASLLRRGAQQTRQIAVDAMAASVGHEIRQPLTALKANAYAGMRQAAKAEPDMKEIQAILTAINADGERIEEIIGSVRNMFRQSTHDRSLLNLNTVIRDVIATVALDIQHHRVVVKTGLGNDLPAVRADSGQLHQVLLNLISNAIEAMQNVNDRPRILTVRSRMVADPSGVAVTVEDTGIGVADKDGRRIFEPFFSTKEKGSGVGLTICQVIIKAHGGTLVANANQPHGTIFRVTLPAGAEGWHR